jgi:hypothetical protein
MIGWLIKKADKWNGVEEFVFSPLHNTSRASCFRFACMGDSYRRWTKGRH